MGIGLCSLCAVLAKSLFLSPIWGGGTGRVENLLRKERLCTLRISSIKENPRITIRELSEDLDISFGTCQTIIKNNLHLKRSPAKFVPHLLTNEQKEHHKETCKYMVEMFNSEPQLAQKCYHGR
ncbi:hypothetical protein LAZ67_10001013 [Cordylochernes scorpioides]|uniref:Uncharacterized protein n=1 Tax=Cordylochernes scorpioides TaxID=51811 RepID=A0ABY6KW16_9ARAC|nr:hypothetical protein LAZ67_10001013 [Cordylochernes scorpioides]